MSTNSVTIKFDLRIVSVVLLLIIVGMLVMWRPWDTTTQESRKITITGTAMVSDTPDEFVFYPSFERTGANIETLKSELNAYGNTLMADLQKLGVAEKDIKLDTSSYDMYPVALSSDASSTSQTITLITTIKVPNKAVAQKVQDYLAKTDAKGQLTSQPSFSTSKQKQLEDKARLLAIADARKKAAATATNVDAKLGKVITVSDESSGGGVIAYAADAMSAGSITTSSLPVTPGTSEVVAAVKVTFQLQ